VAPEKIWEYKSLIYPLDRYNIMPSKSFWGWVVAVGIGLLIVGSVAIIIPVVGYAIMGVGVVLMMIGVVVLIVMLIKERGADNDEMMENIGKEDLRP